MKKTILTSIAALMALAGSARAADVILADFTSGTDPAQGWGNGSIASVVPPVAGTGNWLQLTVNNQYWGQLSIPGWASGGQLTDAYFNANSKLEFDMIFPSATWQGGGVNINAKVTAENATAGLPFANSWMSVASSKDQIVHVALDYSSLGANPVSGRTDLELNINPGYEWMWDTTWNTSGVPYSNQQLYIDNITLTTAPVPEPSMAALGILGALAAFAFRRA